MTSIPDIEPTVVDKFKRLQERIKHPIKITQPVTLKPQVHINKETKEPQVKKKRKYTKDREYPTFHHKQQKTRGKSQPSSSSTNSS